MTAPFARSDEEARLYLDLHACACGSADFDWRQHATALAGESLLVEYTGPCRGCRRPRRFAFTMAQRVAMPAPGAWSELEQPSQLLDPGEWMLVADALAAPYGEALAGGRWPAGRGTDEEERDRATDLAQSAGALDEVLLFLPPGADVIPATAFRSERGRQARRDVPKHFTRDSLEIARDVLRAAIGPFDVAEGGHRARLSARSIREADLWADTHRCPCGLDRCEYSRRLLAPDPGEPDATLLLRGECPLCGTERCYEFAVPDRTTRAPSGPMGYGLHHEGDGPSVVLDPAVFLTDAHHLSRLGDEAIAGGPAERWRDAREWADTVELLCGAVAGYDEVLLFVPAGADRVPTDRIRSAAGRVVLRADPRAFERDWLLAARAERQRVLDEFLAAHPRPVR